MAKMGFKPPAKTAKRFKCPQCSLKFKSLVECKKHQGTHRKTMSKIKKVAPKKILKTKGNSAIVREATKQAAKDTKEDENATCKICNKEFQSKTNLLKHVGRIHKNSKEKEPAFESAPVTDLPSQKVDIKNESDLLCHERIDVDLQNSDIKQTDEAENEESCLICGACNKKFKCMQNFTWHVTLMHCNSVDNLLFSSMTEYVAWKAETEYQTKVTYKSHDASRHTHMCTFKLPSDNPKFTVLCPATILTRIVKNGIEVSFFPQHFGHDTPEYKSNENLDKYRVKTKGMSSILEEFKTLMNNIIQEAHDLDHMELNSLNSEAVLMSEYLKNLKENRNSKTITVKPFAKVYNKNVNQSDDLFTNTTYNDTYQQFVQQNFPQDNQKLKKTKKDGKKGKIEPKNKIKTKLGQFRQVSPKVKNEVDPEIYRDRYTIKVDSYEVKERENDCNILVLKL